jgi:hypothetical protein
MSLSATRLQQNALYKSDKQADKKESAVSFVCMKCYRVYPESKKHSFLCSICHELLVQIDGLFAPVIAELNKKDIRHSFVAQAM